MKSIKPYSLFAYKQIDGRITFRIKPQNKVDLILSDIRQMAIDFPTYAKNLETNIILMSFDVNALVTFDAHFNLFGDSYEDFIKKGIPCVFYITNSDVFVEALNPDDFFAKY